MKTPLRIIHSHLAGHVTRKGGAFTFTDPRGGAWTSRLVKADALGKALSSRFWPGGDGVFDVRIALTQPTHKLVSFTFCDCEIAKAA